MKSAALGIRMHSGWGVLVTIGDTMEVLDRRRIVIVSEGSSGGKMPFHHAEELGLPAAQKYLAGYSAECDRLAQREIGHALDDLKTCGYDVASAALVLASGRALPDLAHILAAHPLIHTAEGELFRDSARRACESLALPVLGYRERDLAECANKVFGRASNKIVLQLAGMGKTLGSPWTADHKSAALAGCLALHATLARARRAKP